MVSKIIKGPGGEFLDPTLLQVSHGRTIISGEIIMASDDAKKLLRQARTEAESLKAKAKQILAQALQEREEEMQRGFEAGYQEGLAQLTEKLLETERAREQILAAQEKEVIEMVLEIAKKVVAREFKKGAVTDVVRQAISQASGDRVVVRTHPTDRPKLEGLKAGLAEVEKSRLLVWQEDEAITPGGCVVETELGTVDARLETQWRAIQSALGLEEKA